MSVKTAVLLVLLGIFLPAALRVGWGERGHSRERHFASGNIVLRQGRRAEYKYDDTVFTQRPGESANEFYLRKFSSQKEPELVTEAVPDIAFPARYSDLGGLCLVFIGVTGIAVRVGRRYE